MKVFVTGSTGYIGSAVVAALVKAGHQVTGLCREGKQARVSAAGATPLVGTLEDTGGWRAAATSAEAAIFIGFDGGPEGFKVNQGALNALLELPGERALLYTSGVWVLGATGDRVATEDSPPNPLPLVAFRPALEAQVLRYKGGAVIRPGIVYGGKGGIIGGFFQSSTEGGAARVVGDGTNRWPCIHRDDLAQLYAKVVEKKATGMFHGVDGAHPRVAELAKSASAAAGKGGAVAHMPAADARKAMGPFADALMADQVIEAPRARSLGWAPAWPSFAQQAERAWQEWKA